MSTMSEQCSAFWDGLAQAFAPPAVASPAGAVPATTGPTGSAVDAGERAATAGSSASPTQSTANCCPPPDWMPIALAEHAKDVREIPGAEAHPSIMAYHDASGYWGEDDSGGRNAWCGSFVAYVFQQAGYGIANAAFRARSWQNDWPTGVNAGRPIYGAVAVKSRTGGGHVGFVMGSIPGRPGYLAILGGNQRDRLSIAEYPASVFLAYMVPEDYPHACCTLEPYEGATTSRGSEG